MGVLGQMETFVLATTSCSVSRLYLTMVWDVANYELMKLIPTHVFPRTVFLMLPPKWSAHPKLVSCSIHPELCRSSITISKTGSHSLQTLFILPFDILLLMAMSHPLSVITQSSGGLLSSRFRTRMKTVMINSGPNPTFLRTLICLSAFNAMATLFVLQRTQVKGLRKVSPLLSTMS